MYYGNRIYKYIYKGLERDVTKKRNENSCPHETGVICGLFFLPAIRSGSDSVSKNARRKLVSIFNFVIAQKGDSLIKQARLTLGTKAGEEHGPRRSSPPVFRGTL